MQPGVSICIPAYKRKDLLEKCLNSIVQQTYTDYEIIVTDDSPDNSVEHVVERFRQNVPGKIHYFKNLRSLGSPENWNEAVRKAKGEYIKIMHHDDWFASEKSLAAFVNAFKENPGTDFVFCATRIIESDTGHERQNAPGTPQLEMLHQDPSILFFGNFIGPPSSVMYRKDRSITFDNKVKYVVDVDFYIHYLSRHKKFVYIHEPLIVNTANDPRQVTGQSLDAVTQVGEYAYLFNKIRPAGIPSKKYVSFFKSLFLKYSIKNIDWFNEHKLEVPRPVFIFSLLIRYLKFNKSYRS